MSAKTYRVSVERSDGISITVAIAVPESTPDVAEFSELAQIGLLQVERVVDRNADFRNKHVSPF